ncbi:HEAT repeat-containing protein 6 isoform X2 [Panulirus ornatus]
MASHMTQEKWNDLVVSFLGVKEPPESGGEEEAEAGLATMLTELCHCSTKLRIMYDHRQIHLLVGQCVSGIVSPGSALARQTSQFLASLLRRQGGMSIPSGTSDKVIAWLSSALQCHVREPNSSQTVRQILRALAAVLQDAPDHTDEIYLSLAGSKGSLIYTLESGSLWQNQALAMQCLHLLTYVTPEVITEARQHDDEIFPSEVVSNIQRIVIGILKQPLPIPDLCPHKVYLHLVASSLSVLYNLVVCAPNDVLGNVIVSACHPFVFYGLPGFPHSELVQHTTGTEVDISPSSGMESDSSSRSYTNRNRRKRLRRKRAQPSRSTSDCDGGPCPLVAAVDGVGLGLRGPPPATALASVPLKPQWARGKQLANAEEEKPLVLSPPVKAPDAESVLEPALQDKNVVEITVSGSETDHSDFEGGGEKETTLMARVRQCSLQAINAVIDKVGKQHKFSYWPPLMCQTPSLMTSVLKDPSPSVRMASLQVINTFLIDSSQVLTLAVENEGKSSYTTLGHQLGTSLRELHRCMALALLSEKFPGALVRTLKTIELLVENVNYSKLKPGLLTKIVTHVKYFMRYKEAVVQANAFSVMVSVLMIKPQIQELRDLLVRYQTPAPPTLTTPPEVMPPPSMEEELPGEEDDEAETNMKKEMERMNLLSEDEEEKAEGKTQARSMVSWLIQRCVDSLLTPDHSAVHGIYIQVQLQSLKVLSALVSEHLSLIHQNLPLIQHVIRVCSDAVREPPISKLKDQTPESPNYEIRNSLDPALMSPDPGVVVEHAYTLLGSLLGAVKADLDKGNEACVSAIQVQQLWLWALQGPLQILFKQAAAEQPDGGTDSDLTADPQKQNAINWRNRGGFRSSNHEDRLKQIVATATVLSHFSPSIFESLGEEWITKIISTVKWLVTNSDPDLRLAGIRIMAIIVSFSSVVGNPNGVSLLQATVVTTCNLLAQRESNVNRDRLLASWALANVSSVFELYVDGWQHHERTSEILSPQLIILLLEVGIRACKDKGKIKPHGVRCVGNVTSFLKSQQVTDPTIAPLVSQAIDTLVLFSSTGSNMKTRWNACHALGNILSSGRLPISEISWRSQVLNTLGKLVESFKNYKVRIQACSAICSLRSREEYGPEYFAIWRVLLHGLDNAQNIIDYQEIRHRDELINQICQGICQLSAHLTLEDAGSLCELLQLHQDMAMPLLKKAYHSLPPERAGHALKAQARVEELLSYDALTEAQQQALTILQRLTASPTG